MHSNFRDQGAKTLFFVRMVSTIMSCWRSVAVPPPDRHRHRQKGWQADRDRALLGRGRPQEPSELWEPWPPPCNHPQTPPGGCCCEADVGPDSQPRSTRGKRQSARRELAPSRCCHIRLASSDPSRRSIGHLPRLSTTTAPSPPPEGSHQTRSPPVSLIP